MSARIVAMTVDTDLKNANSPREVWERLVEGNERFATDNSLDPNRDAEYRQQLTAGQNPAVCIVGLSLIHI